MIWDLRQGEEITMSYMVSLYLTLDIRSSVDTFDDH